MKSKAVYFVGIAAALLISAWIFAYVQWARLSVEVSRQPVFVENLKSQETCEQYGHSWKQVGKAQIFTCIEEYSDGGESCESSTDCQGKCIQRSVDGPATCEQSSNVFGCRNSVENIAAGEGILCID